MKIALASDHGGYYLKEHLKCFLRTMEYKWEDYGTYNSEAVDYPDYGLKAAQSVAQGDCQAGILICGTGIGMSIVANKVKGIRASLCTNSYMAKCSKEHNHANILVLGARVLGNGLAEDIVKTWLSTETAGGRHQRRVDKINALDRSKN